jgi:Helix-turn-helix domain
MTTRHIRWERTGADEHAAAYEEARAALLLGQMVHDRRTELGLTQADLADRAGMTQPQLSRLESGGATPRYRVSPPHHRRLIGSVVTFGALRSAADAAGPGRGA